MSMAIQKAITYAAIKHEGQKRRSMLIDKEAIGAKLWERFNASKEDIEWYYRSIAGVLKKTQVNGFCNFAKSIELFKEFEETIDKVFAG